MITLTILHAAAQDNPISAAAGYSVHGTVVNAVTGQPIARALVDLNEEYAILTGGDGSFSFDNVPAGTYMASVRKPGYKGFGNMVQHGFGVRGGFPTQGGPPHRVQVGADTPSLTFRITPLAAITGTVTLSTTDPADGIQVVVYRRQLQSGRAHWTMGGMTRTNSDGGFRMAGLPAGSYMVYTQPSLDRPAEVRTGNGPVWGYPALYYPGVTDPTAAGVLTLGPGQQAEADFTLTRQQFFAVTAVVNSNLDMASNFQILDSGARPTFLPARYDRRTQQVHANVPNGAWVLDAHGYGRAQAWGRTEFQVAGAPVSFAISVVSVPHIPVIIHREFTSTTNGDQATGSGPGLNLFLMPADDFGSGSSGGGMTPEGDGESWELSVAEPGRYWVVTDAYQQAYVSSITEGGLNLASNPLVVSPGSSLAPIEVTVRNDTGSIAGQVSLGAQAGAASGAAGALGEQKQVWIYAIPLFASAGRVADVMPSDTGQFTFYNLAPGSYRVVACDSQQEIDFHTPEALAAWAGKGQTATVEAGGTANVQLDVLHLEGSE